MIISRYSVFVCTLLLLLIFDVNSEKVKKSKIKLLTITGTGEENINATLTEFAISINLERKFPSDSDLVKYSEQDRLQDMALDVQRMANNNSNEVVNTLKTNPYVTNLQTTGLKLQPIFAYKDTKRYLVGYSASNSFSFRIDCDKSGTLIDDLVKAGITNIDSITFVCRQADIEEAQKRTLQKAALQARDQAKAILDSLGLKQKEIFEIEGNTVRPSASPRYFDMSAYAIQAQIPAQAVTSSPAYPAFTYTSTPILPQEQKIIATVTIKVYYE